MPAIGPAPRSEVDTRWQMSAACQGADTDIFYPVKGGGQPENSLLPAAADAYCRTCDVVAECLNYAMRNNEYGIWGGTTRAVRRALRRATQRRTCPSCSSRSLVAHGKPPVQFCTACGASWSARRQRSPATPSRRPNLGIRRSRAVSPT